MKTALLITGFPRFCEDFDYQLSNLHGTDFEWIMLLWKTSPENYGLSEASSPSWLQTVTDEKSAREYIESRVPSNHKLKYVEFVDWSDFPEDYIQGDYPRQITIDVGRFFRQYYMVKRGIHKISELGDYDLIFRTRPDMGLEIPIYFDRLNERLNAEPNRIVISSNHRQENFVDLFVIGKPQAMMTYASTVDCINDFYFNKNFVMHTENMLSNISKHNGLVWYDEGYTAFLRKHGTYLTQNYIEGQKYFEPNFGKW